MSNSNGEEDLERLFGDPFDDHNPVGFRAVLAADSARRLPAAGERLLDEWNCNAEFVPVALGGRWRDVDELGRRLRPVFRRDAALGLGYGVTSLMAAVNVWTAGSAAQQDWLSGELLQRRRTAVAFHELAHGNDLLRNDCTARITDGQVIFRGRKEVINNVERAESVLLLARTGEDTGGRSQSLFLIDKKELSPHPGYLPRWATTGMRACELGGIDVTGCQAPAATLVGLPGTAAETAMRAFQITRVALPSMALGILDTALHLAYRFAVARQVYGQSVSDLPVVRATLAAAFVDLLTADCLATAAARALQLDPRPGAGLAAAVKYLVPQLLDEAM
ncbi:MAG: hypothetical protein QOI74_3640, partial [Micromonosporaceae bacterium]|nr:hypothetical protein [Micromonosporaceae bacterium]